MTTENVIPVNTGNQDVMKGRQETEAANRKTAEGIEVIDGAGEDVVVSDAATPHEPTDTSTPEPARRQRTFSDGDEMRNAIVANFKRNRAANLQNDDASEDARQIKEFMRSGGMPKEFQDTFVDDQPPADVAADAAAERSRTLEPEPEPQPEPEPVLPRKFKLKVRGGEREVTEEELVALAQKNEAADEYMTEAKATLNEVKALKRDLESRPSPAATPAADRAATEGQPTPTADATPATDPFKDMAEALLYSDPDTAAVKTRGAITTEVPKIVEQVLNRHRRQSELAASMERADRFQKENADIASDPIAVDTIRGMIIRKQREDLAALGIDVAKLPSDSEVTNAHLTFRSDPRYAVRIRSPDKLFDEAKADFSKWRGVTPTTPANEKENGNGQVAVPVQRTTPEIQVDVNRTARRQAIPQQPSRTAVVRQVPPAAPAPKTKSQIIADMRKARGQPEA